MISARYHVPCCEVARTLSEGTWYLAMWSSSWEKADFNKTMEFFQSSNSLCSFPDLSESSKILTGDTPTSWAVSECPDDAVVFFREWSRVLA